MKSLALILTVGLIWLGAAPVFAESAKYGYERPRVSEPQLNVNARIESVQESGREYKIQIKSASGHVQDIRANKTKFQKGNGQAFDPKNVRVGASVSVHYTQAESSTLPSVRNREVSRIFIYDGLR